MARVDAGDAAGDATRVERATRRIFDALRDDVLDGARDADDARARAKTLCDALDDARVVARATRDDGVDARARRDARARFGRALVRACGAARRDVATVAEIAAFATRGDARADDATRRAMARGIETDARRMHANGTTMACGAIAAEEALEACARGGFWGARWRDATTRATTRATRAIRRRFGVDDDDDDDDDGVVDAGGGGDEAWRAMGDGRRAWDDASTSSEAADDATRETADETGGEDLNDARARDDASASSEDDDDAMRDAADADASSDEDEDDDEKAFLRVDGAEIRAVEADHEYVMREILAMRNESQRTIAGRIQEKVARVEGATASVEARRAKLLQSLLSKYSRADASENARVFVRETSSSTPRYHFFRGTESAKTRIVAANAGVRFRSVDAYVKAKKRAERERGAASKRAGH